MIWVPVQFHSGKNTPLKWTRALVERSGAVCLPRGDQGWSGWEGGQPGEFRAGTCAPRTLRAVNPGSHRCSEMGYQTEHQLKRSEEAPRGFEGIHCSPPPEKVSSGAVRLRVARTEWSHPETNTCPPRYFLLQAPRLLTVRVRGNALRKMDGTFPAWALEMVLCKPLWDGLYVDVLTGGHTGNAGAGSSHTMPLVFALRSETDHEDCLPGMSWT